MVIFVMTVTMRVIGTLTTDHWPQLNLFTCSCQNRCDVQKVVELVGRHDGLWILNRVVCYCCRSHGEWEVVSQYVVINEWDQSSVFVVGCSSVARSLPVDCQRSAAEFANSHVQVCNEAFKILTGAYWLKIAAQMPTYVAYRRVTPSVIYWH
jgi:hypothetical protein